jgi:hypothetical protein
MKGAKITLPNERRFALVPRSGSYSIIWQSIPKEDRKPNVSYWHPINATSATIGSPLKENESTNGLCCLVRDPIERFRSACARQKKSVEEGLSSIQDDVHFWTLLDMGLLQDGTTYFRFPDQIDICAEWLGLSTPVPKLNGESEGGKPILTDEEVDYIRFAYSADISVWQSLQ